MVDVTVDLKPASRLRILKERSEACLEYHIVFDRFVLHEWLLTFGPSKDGEEEKTDPVVVPPGDLTVEWINRSTGERGELQVHLEPGEAKTVTIG